MGSPAGLFRFGFSDSEVRTWKARAGSAGLNLRRLRRTVNVLHRRTATQNSQDVHDSIYVLRDTRAREQADPVITSGIEAAIAHAETTARARLSRDDTAGRGTDTATASCGDYRHSPFSPHGLTFATWLTGRDITALSAVTAEVLTDYSAYLARTRRVARMTAVNHLVALTRLAAYAPVLPEDLRIQAPAWDLEGLDHYLPATSASGENVTEPIDAATIGPLLVWAVRFVEEFSGDVLAARAEEQRLRDIAGCQAAMPATRGRPPALLAYLEGLESAGLPVPTLTRHREQAAATYIAGLAGVPAAHVRRVFGQPR